MLQKNLSASTRKSTYSKGKFSSHPSDPHTIGSDHFEDSSSLKIDLSNDAHSPTDKAPGMRPMEEDVEALTPKKVKIDLEGLLEFEVYFWDTLNKDNFRAFKEKLIAHGRIVNLDDMEGLNCKVKKAFDFQG